MSCKITKKCTICDRLSHFFSLPVCLCLSAWAAGEGATGKNGQKKQRSVSRRTSETNTFHENMTVSHIQNYYVKKIFITAKLQ